VKFAHNLARFSPILHQVISRLPRATSQESRGILGRFLLVGIEKTEGETPQKHRRIIRHTYAKASFTCRKGFLHGRAIGETTAMVHQARILQQTAAFD
jgi:hypothetical protein